MARLTVTQAAQQLGVSVDVVRRRVRKGELAAQRDNRGQWWVETPDGSIAPAMQVPDLALVEALRGQVADLATRLDGSEADRRGERAGRDAEREQWSAERERWDAERCWLLALVEAAVARPAAELAALQARLDQAEAEAARRRDAAAADRAAKDGAANGPGSAVEAAAANGQGHGARQAETRFRRALRALRGLGWRG